MDFKIILSILLILYISNINITMPLNVWVLYQNPLFRLSYLIGLAYVSQTDMLLALLMGMAYVLTHQVLTEKNITDGFIEGFMDI
jgi:hypothetical protein